MSLYFITGNEGKFAEVKKILSKVKQLDIDLIEIQDLDPKVIIEHKLREAQEHQQGELIVEDTSLYLSCMKGLPGPLIKWFMKTMGNEGLVKIVQLFGDDTAEVKTIIGHTNLKGEINFYEGVIKGKIVSPRGGRGFGWDPIFEPEGYRETFAEMSLGEKNKISMRKLAVSKLKDNLQS